jgi:DNA polymerase delta subunit 1
MRGRQMIDETKTYVEANFPGAKVRYGDTDSVMVEFDVQGRKGQEAIDYSWELGERAASECTKLFKEPNELELEKVYCPYFLYSKKRYAAKLYEKNKQGEVVFKKIDVKGLQVVRRDSCAYVRETLKQLLEMVLESDDPLPAIKFARQAAKDLTEGKVPYEKLLMSKQLASAYKVRMPHVTVRDKIRARAPGSEPKQGDRVSFLIVEAPRDALLADKAEDPAWVLSKGLKIDYKYYYTNQMRNPVCDFLEPLVGKNPEQVIFPTSRKITEFFTPR